MALFGEAGQEATGQALGVIVKGGGFLIGISTDSVKVAEKICEMSGKTALTLGVLYVSYKLLRPLIDAAVRRALGGERDDQEVREIKPGSLHVLLHCFTDERFLEVFEDYESGRMKERFQEEFSKVGTEMEGLKVEILNMDTARQTLAAIDVRRSAFAKAREKDEASTADISNEGIQINISVEHGNWLTVGELIRAVRKPISIYAEEIVKAFHEKLCKDLLGIGKCKSPDDCKKKTKSSDLCRSCKCWFKELGKSHKTGNNPSWRKNCDSARWSEDHWEVAKFFMSARGDNLSTVKDAESTDLSSLLNVLEWMKDTAFLGKNRVDVDLVRKLRSEVRNTWAHAPKQELTDGEKDGSFSIAIKLLKDLEKGFPKLENEECLKHLKELNDKGVRNVVECELRSLLLQRQFLHDIKEEITSIKHEQSSAKNAIEEYGEKFEKLELALNQWSQKMSDFQSLKDNIDEQFKNFAKESACFSEVPDDIREIREIMHQIHDRYNVEREPTSCLPGKVPMFTAREDEIQKVISSLTKDEKAIVLLHGGPGFGKTAIAVEVSHKLDEEHNIPVIFSQLRNLSTISEMILGLCRDVGVNYEDDPKSSLILWLKNIKKKVVFVLDAIDYLLEKKTDLYDFLRLMRKDSNGHCQIVTTSREFYSIPELSASVSIGEMDDASAIQLLKQTCPDQNEEFWGKLAKLCGHIPLAMCIAASRVVDFKDPNELLQYLENQPMKILKSPESNLFVDRAINMSYKMLDNEKKEALFRLAVFEGSYSEAAARAVIKRENLDTKDILRDLVRRSLIKQPIPHRYLIHLLIRSFLYYQLESAENRSHAETLMVEFYLNLGHELTINSYSKDGYKTKREALKKEAHNIQNVLKICSQQEDITSHISTSLTKSKIYTSSAKFFFIFVRTVIPGSTVDAFLQHCSKLAGERNELAIKINFDCLLAHQLRIATNGKSDEYFKMMKKIEKEFEKHYEELKENKSVCAHYYYEYGRYMTRKSAKTEHPQDLFTEARTQQEKSLSLIRQISTETAEGKADMVFSILQLGNMWKMIAINELHNKRTAAIEESAKASAEEYYKEAIELSQRNLGEHELTSACYKSFGDYFLRLQELKMAEENYTIANEMRETLGLDASEKHVNLLNNLGKCLTHSKRPGEAIRVLEKACDMAEKLAQSDEPNECKAKVYTSLAIAHNSEKRYSEKAVNYAKKAMEYNRIDKIIETYEHEEIKRISSMQSWNK